MTLRKGKIVQENPYKKLYSTNEQDRELLCFTDSFLSKKRKTPVEIKGKGKQNSTFTVSLYRYLESYKVPTHFIDQYKNIELLVRHTEPVPVYTEIWNVACGDICTKYGLREGAELQAPILEFHYLNKKLKDPLVTKDHILALGLLSQEETDSLDGLARKTNTVMRAYFERRNFRLCNLLLQFGITEDGPIICGDMSFESIKVWDVSEDAGNIFAIYSPAADPESIREFGERISL